MVRADTTRIRDRMAAIANPKVRASARVEEVVSAIADIHIGVEVDRGGLVIRFQKSPRLIRDEDGVVIGIDAYVQVLEGGVELAVDPHRVCINPPTLVPDGTTHQETDALTGETYDVSNFREDPREAYLSWLEQSLRTTPKPMRTR